MFAIIVGPHGLFAKELVRSCEMICGEKKNVRAVTLVPGEGPDDVVKKYEEAIKELDCSGGVLFLTDLFGGSVNNEFTKIVQTRPNTYLVANMNLPLLSQLLFSDQEAPADQVIREILAADDTRVKFVNDLLTDADDEEEF